MVHIIVVGDEQIGKTTLCHLMSNQYKERYHQNLKKYFPTIGVDFVEQNTTPGGVKCVIWDTSGQERFLSVLGNYLDQCNVVLLCFDLSRRDTFDNLPKWYNRCKALMKPVLLVGCKHDVAGDVIPIDDIGAYAAKIQASYYPTSSKCNSGVIELKEALNLHLDMIKVLPSVDIDFNEIRPQRKQSPPAHKKPSKYRKLFCCFVNKGYVVFDNDNTDDTVSV